MSRKTPFQEAKAYLERRRDRPDHVCINEDDQWEDDDITYGTLRALVAQIELDEQRLADRDRLETENATMKTALTAALKVIRPLWDAAITHLVPLWKALEPILESAVESEQRNGVCKICNAEIRYREEVAGTTDVAVTHWWEHVDMPRVAHNAVPKSESETEDQYIAYSNGDYGTCSVCHGMIRYIVHDVDNGAGETETLDAWWSHVKHPEDDHTATPMPPQSTCTYPVGRGAEGTAPCGFLVELHEERSVLMADGTDGRGNRGGRQILVWHHVERSIDHMHTPQPKGLEWSST